MNVEHINNLVSLTVEATVDAMRDKLPDLTTIEEHLHNTELYGELPECVIKHILYCVTTIASNIRSGELK